MFGFTSNAGAKRQPVASDLREIIGSIRIAADLERVGDLGKSNAKRVIAVQSTGIPRPLARGIEHLSELALTQLKDVLDVYSTRSAEKAEQIRIRDGEAKHITEITMSPDDMEDLAAYLVQAAQHARELKQMIDDDAAEIAAAAAEALKQAKEAA